MIGSKELKFSVFDLMGVTLVVIRKFGKNRSKTLPMGYFLQNIPDCGHKSKLE